MAIKDIDKRVSGIPKKYILRTNFRPITGNRTTITIELVRIESK